MQSSTDAFITIDSRIGVACKVCNEDGWYRNNEVNDGGAQLEPWWHFGERRIRLQDHDDPSTYSNHTCEVKGCNHKRQHEDPAAAMSARQGKRLRTSESHSASPASDAGYGDLTANEGQQHANRSIGSRPSDEEPRINPIDHIFQFHKVI